jgi:ABC-2 type transport system ATP-binding protein
MVRRLEIGQAILHRPAVVFLDEPTVGLDPLARQALWTHIQSLQKNYGTTLFLTTHFMDEAQELCHRVAIMNKGSIRVIGTLAELRRKAKRPKADMDELFIHFVGPVALDEKGDLSDVKRVRRTARRLG